MGGEGDWVRRAVGWGGQFRLEGEVDLEISQTDERHNWYDNERGNQADPSDE